MANTFTSIVQTVIMPLSLEVLRENAVMAGLVFQNFETEIAEHNKQINIPLPFDMGTAQDMDTTNGSTALDLSPTTVNITMENWKEKTFKMNDKEIAESVINGVLPGAMSGAVKVLANKIDTDLIALYKDMVYGSGTPGTTPTADDDIIAVRKILQDNLAPGDDRSLVMNTAAEAQFLEAFNKANEVGSTDALRNASLGRLFNFDTYADQNITTHTAGVLVPQTAVGAKAITAIGETSIDLDDTAAGTLTGSVAKGDRVTFAGDTTKYRVTTAVTAAAGELTIIVDPALVVALADGTVLTQIGNYTPNLAFQRDAMVLAVRPLADLGTFETSNSVMSTVQDPISGITLRLEMWREPGKAQNFYRYDILYGVKLIRPELAAIMYG